jgi:CRISPR-associated endonuclease/helicase Cas3
MAGDSQGFSAAIEDKKKRDGEQQTYRILDMIVYLVNHQEGVTRQELAGRYRVSRHTIYRDLPKVEAIAPISTTCDGKIYIDRKDYQVNVRFTLHEAMAVHLAARLLASRMDRRNRHAASALEKLSVATRALAPTISRQMEQSAQSMNAADQWNDPVYIEVLELLTEAWATGRKVLVRHLSERTGEITEYIVWPYCIEPYATGQSTHLIGWDEGGGILRTLKIERIASVELLKEPYTIPADFDLQALLEDAWGIWFTGKEPVEVVLRFSPRAARRVKESRWHRSQRIEEQAEGYLVWRARLATWVEMLPWIRGWGAEVEVLSPPDLRAELAAEAKRMGEVYQ